LFCTSVQDYVIHATGADIEQLDAPFALPANAGLVKITPDEPGANEQTTPAGFFPSLEKLVEGTLMAVVEGKREEMIDQVRNCGGVGSSEGVGKNVRVPSERYTHLRLKGDVLRKSRLQVKSLGSAASAVRVAGLAANGGSTADNISVAHLILPTTNKAAYDSYPLDEKRGNYAGYMVVIHSQGDAGSDRNLQPVCTCLVERMNQKQGMVLRGHRAALQAVQAAVAGGAHMLYVRRLIRFDAMSMGPLGGMQRMVGVGSGIRERLASADADGTSDGSGTSLVAKLFMGAGVREMQTVDDEGRVGEAPEASMNEYLARWQAEEEGGQGGSTRGSTVGRVSTAVPQNGKTIFSSFNDHQQKALASDACTRDGVVLIQGPPGTGKSHLIACGILPHATLSPDRKENVLVLCNR
jgi:hypothetical protein